MVTQIYAGEFRIHTDLLFHKACQNLQKQLWALFKATASGNSVILQSLAASQKCLARWGAILYGICMFI